MTNKRMLSVSLLVLTWKLNFVRGVRDLKWFVDGKRVEPGKPYDPNAPAYEPKEK